MLLKRQISIISVKFCIILLFVILHTSSINHGFLYYRVPVRVVAARLVLFAAFVWVSYHLKMVYGHVGFYRLDTQRLRDR